LGDLLGALGGVAATPATTTATTDAAPQVQATDLLLAEASSPATTQTGDSAPAVGQAASGSLRLRNLSALDAAYGGVDCWHAGPDTIGTADAMPGKRVLSGSRPSVLRGRG